MIAVSQRNLPVSDSEASERPFLADSSNSLNEHECLLAVCGFNRWMHDGEPMKGDLCRYQVSAAPEAWPADSKLN